MRQVSRKIFSKNLKIVEQNYRILSINEFIQTDTTEMTNEFSNIQLKSSISNAELPTTKEKKTNKPNCSELSKWNPFEDPTPFNQMTEDHIYEAEFDALRDRPIGN